MNNLKKAEKLAHCYLDIKNSLIEDGYAWEIDWQSEIQTKKINESQFLSELGWVILSSGMRESVVRNKFPSISDAFLNWESAYAINVHSESCFDAATAVFNHKGKIAAILTSASLIIKYGFSEIMRRLRNDGPQILKLFPYIGSTTCYHLAKNIGFSTSKPDRHLQRIAAATGYQNPKHFCDVLSSTTGDNVSVVDIVFWRYASLNPNYLSQIDEKLTDSLLNL